jgi:branched-chain amino acid transport system ATP-binding protein
MEASVMLERSPAPTQPSVPILSVRNLTRRFGGLLAVDDVGFDIAPATILALIGPNGAGKSTTVNLLTGVLAPSSGEVVLEGRDLVGLSPHVIVGRGLVRTYQNGRLYPRLDVLENVLVGGEGGRITKLYDAVLRTPAFRREDRRLRDEAAAHLKALGLGDVLQRKPLELPYGKQRKLEIARALMTRPKVLLLDEPAAGLNSGEVEDLITFVSGLRASGISILLIEHNMGLVMRLADHITVLNFGRSIASGTPTEIRENEAVIEAYLGRRKSHAGH